MKRGNEDLEIEELVKKYYQNPNDDIKSEIIGRFRRIVDSCASKLFLVGGDKDDLIQEGNIGLMKSFDYYNPEKMDKFIPFGIMCIKRAQLNAVKKSSTQIKDGEEMYTFVSIDAQEDKDALEIEDPRALSPEKIMLGAIGAVDTFKQIEKVLSKTENEVLMYLVDGLNYKEIAEVLDKSPKSIDNTIQRIKAKVTKVLEDNK